MPSFPSFRRAAGLAPLALLPLLAACGGGGGGTPAPDATSATAAVVTPTAASSVTATATATPASLMDLSGWKLNLPVDAYGGTGGIDGVQYPARTVLPQDLVAGFSDDFFRADAQGRIVFTAPANGAVTTPGNSSDHTRSELREFDRNGDAKGDWTGTGSLAATCAVQQVASASNKAIIGQLKGENHVFAQVQYRVATQDIAVDVYHADTDGSSHAATVLVPGVALGQPIAYTLSFSGGVLTATANGASRSFTVDGSWNIAPLYFKVGAYHGAPNIGNPAQDRTTVTCASIAITH